jgi:hypothetical protein
MYSYQLHIAVVAMKTGEVWMGICSEKEKNYMLKHRMGNQEGTMQSHTHIEQKTQNKAKQNKAKNTIQKLNVYANN